MLSNKTILILFGLFVLGIIPQIVKAQQQEMYTQYMFNAVAINPAFSGVHEAVSATIHLRDQWGGLEGAPKTQTFSIHSPIKESSSASGINIMRDAIGITSYTNVELNYAYRIAFTNGAKFSMGLSAGINQFKDDPSLVDANDPSSLGFVAANEILPNFGFGALYYGSRFYAGISIPTLLNSTVDRGTSSSLNLKKHYFLAAGYLFDIQEQIKFKPNILVKAVEGAPISVDLNGNFLINDVIWLGVSWRSMASWSGLVEINVTPQLILGYAYDLTHTELSQIENGSHEIMLNYRFLYKDNGKVLTPRYF